MKIGHLVFSDLGEKLAYLLISKRVRVINAKLKKTRFFALFEQKLKKVGAFGALLSAF